MYIESCKVIIRKKLTKENAVLLLLGSLCIFLHTYRLGSIPRGIYVDEMGMAYDAYSLGKYGVDRYLKSFPLYLTNFGGGQSVLYCYLAIPFIKILGINAFAIRIPALLFSCFTMIFGYLLVKDKWNKRAGILFLFIYTILPYFTMAARIGLDCNLMLGMSVIVLFCLHKSISTDEIKRRKYFFLTGLSCGALLYTYALSYLILPVFIMIIFGYLLWIGKISWKYIVIVCIPLITLSLPLLVIQMINIFDMNEMNAGCFTLTKIDQYRGSEISLNNIKSNLGWIYRSIFETDITEFDNFPQYSNMYAISIPFLVVGTLQAVIETITSLKKREYNITIPIFIWSFVELGSSLFITGVTTYRINGIFFALSYFVVMGILCIFELGRAWSKLFLVLSTIVYCLFFLSFANYYFNDYPNEYYPQKLFGDNMSDAIDYLESQPDNIRERTVYVGGINEAYIYYLGSTGISPYEYKIAENGNIQYGKYIFYYPDEIDLEANYIIYAPYREYIDQLSALGFYGTQHGEYYVFINKSADYKPAEDTSCVQYGWDGDFKDLKIGSENTLLLSGWCVNRKEKKIFDCILLYAADEWITATRYERTDIADILGSETFCNCGFSFEIPEALWEKAEQKGIMYLICIDHEKEVYYRVPISILLNSQ